MTLAMARMCDRCGKLYEYYPKSNESRYNALRPIQMAAVGNAMDIGLAMDLCPKCMDAFEKFMTDEEWRKNCYEHVKN